MRIRLRNPAWSCGSSPPSKAVSALFFSCLCITIILMNDESPFRSSTYAVRPRTTWIGSLFGGRHSDYEFQSVPPMSSEWYVFSWDRGILQRAPNGPALLAVAPPRRPGRLFSGEYSVRDAATGAVLGRLVPAGRNWEVLDAAGRADMKVFEEHAGFRRAKFVARIDNKEVCLFSWAIAGVTVRSAVLTSNSPRLSMRDSTDLLPLQLRRSWSRRRGSQANGTRTSSN